MSVQRWVCIGPHLLWTQWSVLLYVWTSVPSVWGMPLVSVGICCVVTSNSVRMLQLVIDDGQLPSDPQKKMFIVWN
jgi:hypothetical protein